MKTLICPCIPACPIYNNWVEQMSEKYNKLDIILQDSLLDNPSYSCLALTALEDMETGISKNKELEKRLKSKNINCSYIEILNKSNK